jgi:hypothetical protein
MSFDFTPKGTINPRDFIRDADPYGKLFPSFIQGQQVQEENKKKQILQQLMQSMGQSQQQQLLQQPTQQMMQPQPLMPPMQMNRAPQGSPSQIPPGQPMSAGPGNIGQDVQMPQQQPPQQSQQQGGLSQQQLQMMAQIDPQGTIKYIMDQNDVVRQAQAKRYSQMGAPGGGGKSTWYESDDGTISKNPSEGSFPVQLSDAQGAQYSAVPKSAKSRNDAMAGRNEAWNRSIDTKQINELAKRTGITPKQQSVLQNNSMRAFRAIPILSKPNLTYQELALGEIDLAGMMQGGVPQVDEIHNTHFPGWQEQWSRLKTYATGHPNENVPPEVRKKVLDLIKGVVQIDNTFLKQNKSFSQDMLAPTIRGGVGQFNKPIQDMTDMLTGKGAMGEEYSGDKEKRYQEYLKRRNGTN